MLFFVTGRCQVRIRLPCVDDSNTNIISAKNVKTFSNCDVANVRYEVDDHVLEFILVGTGFLFIEHFCSVLLFMCDMPL